MEKLQTNKKPLTEVQKKIIQAATRKFAKNGYQKTSMNEIVGAAGVSKGSLFYHFHSKEDLFFQVLILGVKQEFQRVFEIFEKKGGKLFKKRENLFEDLKKYYDLTSSGPREFERLWLEGRIESENNPKLREMMTIQDKEIALAVVGSIKQIRPEIGILEGYDDVALLEIAKGMIAVFRGLFLEKLAGKDPREIKKTWVRTIHAIYSSKKNDLMTYS